MADVFDCRAEEKSAIACVHRALDRGITLIDTANVYSRGAAERVLGEALAGIRRDSYVPATKLFFPMSETDRGLGASRPEQIDENVAASGHNVPEGLFDRAERILEQARASA